MALALLLGFTFNLRSGKSLIQQVISEDHLGVFTLTSENFFLCQDNFIILAFQENQERFQIKNIDLISLKSENDHSEYGIKLVTNHYMDSRLLFSFFKAKNIHPKNIFSENQLNDHLCSTTTC